MIKVAMREKKRDGRALKREKHLARFGFAGVPANGSVRWPPRGKSKLNQVSRSLPGTVHSPVGGGT